MMVPLGFASGQGGGSRSKAQVIYVWDSGEPPTGAHCVSSSSDINAFNPVPACVVASDGSIGSRTLRAIR